MAFYILNFTKKGARKGAPLREQAVELLEAGLWGIGPKTQHRQKLAPGDQVVAYVGAPEKLFVGSATLASPVHPWTSDESARYPEFESPTDEGLAFESVSVWETPIPLMSVWPQCPSSSTNKEGLFMSGVFAITEADFKAITGGAPQGVPAMVQESELQISQVSPQAHTEVPGPSSGNSSLKNDLEKVSKDLRGIVDSGQASKYKESKTRSVIIDPLIKALGYDFIEDVEPEHTTTGNDAADYLITIESKPVLVIEAKALKDDLKEKDADQAVKYAAVKGVRWAMVTNGRYFRLYDQSVLGTDAAKRIVFEVDLASSRSDEEFRAAIVAKLGLLSREELASGGLTLSDLAAREAIRETLLDKESNALIALRDELEFKKGIKLTPEEVLDLSNDLLSS